MNENDILILRIRSLIADKEMITAQANLDLARGGEWRCDWTIGHAQIDAEIEELHSLANASVLPPPPVTIQTRRATP